MAIDQLNLTATSISSIETSSINLQLVRYSMVSTRIPFSSNLNPISIKLDRNNYGFWRSQILLVVKAYKHDGCLTRTKMCPLQSIEKLDIQFK